MDETDCDVAPGSAINIGDPIEATDTDGDLLTYSLEGSDAQYFTIDRNTGQIKTEPGVIYDYEATQTYTVTVKVSDGRDNDTIEIEVTIDVDDLSRGAVQAARAEGKAGQGGRDRPVGELESAAERGSPAHHGLRSAIPDGPGRGLAGRPAGCRQHEHYHYDDQGFRRGIALALRGAGPGAERRGYGPGRSPDGWARGSRAMPSRLHGSSGSRAQWAARCSMR